MTFNSGIFLKMAAIRGIVNDLSKLDPLKKFLTSSPPFKLLGNTYEYVS